MYDLVRNAFTALIAQWRLMSREFDRLAADFDRESQDGELSTSERQELERRRDECTELADRCRKVPNPPVGNIPADNIIEKLEAFLKVIDVPSSGKLDRLQELFNSADQGLIVNTTDWLDTVGIFETLFPRSLKDAHNVASSREQLDDLGSFIRRRQQDLLEVSSLVGERANIRQMRGAVEALGSFPILTSEYGGSPSSVSGPGTSGLPSSGLRRIVDSALRDVLGRNARPNDTRSFVSALKQSFEITEVEGRTEVAWRPRSFVGHADLGGGVTGAQASLYNSATVGLENILPLLDGLYPLRSDADEEDSLAILAIIRTELIELVEELKLEGGPRVARINSLFEQLADTSPGSPSQLDELKNEFGLENSNINTLDEELNVSNFIAINDFVTSLRTSWNSFAKDLLGKDLGTRFVLLSRGLSVAAEAVDEVIASMDSVFVGAAERQVASFVADDLSVVVVDDLLSWITTFTTQQAPSLIQNAGRRGVASIVPTVVLLDDLVDKLIKSISTDPSIPSGLRHPRVINPLHELATYLDQIRRYAEDVSLPLRNGK